MSRSKTVAAVIVVVCLTVPAFAEICTIDAVPAATVLVPYFEVNLNNLGPWRSASGPRLDNTKVTLINNSPEPIIVHVTLWTNLSLPTLDFDIPLTGFDEHDMDIDQIFNGVLPIPSGSHGPGCSQFVGPTPMGPDDGFGYDNISPPIDNLTVQDVRNAHTGRSSPAYGGCMGRSTGNNIATGYITMDVTNACTVIFPNDPDYFGNGSSSGIATNDNVLTATITRFSKKFLTDVPAIMIEADDNLNTGYTFYGRYTQEQAFDNRECGSNTYVFPFDTRMGLKTFVQVWRDSRQDFGTATGFSCGSTPSWYPLAPSDRVIAYDDQENARELELENPLFPAETQSVQVGKGNFRTPYSTGWIKLILGEQEELPSYAIINQRNRKRQAEAWAHYATSTLCDNLNNGAEARRRSRRGR